MATVAHCLYCFESLSANLEHRKPLGLAQVEDLWNRYRTEVAKSTSSYQDVEQNEPTGHREAESEEGEPAPDEENADCVELNTRPSKAQKRTSSTARASQRSDVNVPSPSPTPSSTSSTPSAVSKASSIHTDSSISVSSSRSSLSSGSRLLKSIRNTRNAHSEQHPMFITWNSISRGQGKNLRGCIGTFDSQPLEEGLGTYALTSALEDVRFPPITASELPFLECGVTLLTDFEPASTPMSWDIGKHGLRISFTHQSKRLGATYLPDVAREQGWTKTETIVSLMRKAGWSGRRDEWQSVGDLNVVRYQGDRANVSYETWKAWRDWVDEQLNGAKFPSNR